jgi:enoyl-CoA hydratase/carnithine racemase
VMTRGLDEEGLAEAMRRQDEYPAVIAMRGSDDAQEGTRAFLAKRKPRWRGE